MLAVGLALAVGCKDKKAGAPSASTPGPGAGSEGATAPPSGAAANTPPPTAAGSAVEALAVVNDCPKSLGGTEKVARTIQKACGPIIVTETLTIDGSLTLEAGVVLKFQPDAELVVGYHGPAKLIVQGGDAPAERVVFTSAGDQAAGVWRGVTLRDGAARSRITGLDIEYAGPPDGAAISLHDAVDITFTSSTIKHAKQVGLIARGTSSFAQLSGIRLEDTGKVAMSVEAATVGTIGAGNTFPADSFVEIRGGTVAVDATWRNPGAPYHVNGTVYVEAANTATLTITDATLKFATDAELAIGYRARGKLVITGPALLTSIDGTPGTWPGLRIHDSGDATIAGATFSSGGTADGGALTVRRDGKLTLGAVTFKDNKIGLWVDDLAKITAPGPLTFTGNERAAHLWPTGLGALTGANVYGDGQIIEVAGGDLHADTTWLTQPKAAVQILGDISTDGSYTLTISAGGTYQWKADTGLTIGYRAPGTLKIAGRADAPVTFAALVKGEPWKGIDLNDSARSIVLSHLALSDVDGDGGVLARKGVTGKLDHVSCARCAATVAPACGAKLETTAVTAGAETKLAIKPPTGC